MNRSADLPPWATFIIDPPRVIREQGSFLDAIEWKDEISQDRFYIEVGREAISLNIAQAAAIVEMLRELGAEYGGK
jgi:hypothetical protein